MFDHLQIYNRRERVAVGVADTVINLATSLVPHRSGAEKALPCRVLLLRLERIGDLLMSLEALEAIRRHAPSAHLHLVVGSWNASIASLLRSVDSHETLDAPWLARQATGATMGALMRRARGWRGERFDLAINFEPDIRSNLLLYLSGAQRRVGFGSAGGGGLLTDALDYDRSVHTSENLLRLVTLAIPSTLTPAETPAVHVPRLQAGDAARDTAGRLLERAGDACLVGVHVSGGRPVKQWPIERFADVATRLGRALPAQIVLTGSAEDRPLVQRVRELLPPDVVAIDVAGALDLPALGAVLQQLRLFVTGDTGPMHLAAAVGTPTVAIFGPSDPRRYGPLGDRARVLTADLWCRPCNRVRRPPARCSHGTPDCLRAISTDDVVKAATELLTEGVAPRRSGTPGRTPD